MTGAEQVLHRRIGWTKNFILCYYFIERLIYLREEERERGREGERDREHEQEGQREERESQTDSKLSMEPDVGLDPRALRSGPKPKPRARYLTDCATEVPLNQQI